MQIVNEKKKPLASIESLCQILIDVTDHCFVQFLLICWF